MTGSPLFVAGFASMGMDVRTFGPVPTPGVAMMTRSMRADLGVMISASHNDYADNGIKLSGPDGYKLSDDIELQIERLMQEDQAPAWPPRPAWAGSSGSTTPATAMSRSSRRSFPNGSASRACGSRSIAPMARPIRWPRQPCMSWGPMLRRGR